MGVEAWRTNLRGGIIEKESWRRILGKGIVEEALWRRNLERGITEESSGRQRSNSDERLGSWTAPRDAFPPMLCSHSAACCSAPRSPEPGTPACGIGSHSLTDCFEAAGVEVTYSPYDGVFHGFFGMAGMMAKAGQAQEEAAAALRGAFGS